MPEEEANELLDLGDATGFGGITRYQSLKLEWSG